MWSARPHWRSRLPSGFCRPPSVPGLDREVRLARWVLSNEELVIWVSCPYSELVDGDSKADLRDNTRPNRWREGSASAYRMASIARRT